MNNYYLFIAFIFLAGKPNLLAKKFLEVVAYKNVLVTYI
jgi:hypothetical protein